ncbi:DUF2877 domain-containing protein, partial [Nocardioides kongjuensis]
TLTEALAGRGRQRIHVLVSALSAAGTTPALVDAVLRVRAVGHTSGADILTGFRLGLELEADLREADRLADPTHSKEIS